MSTPTRTTRRGRQSDQAETPEATEAPECGQPYMRKVKGGQEKETACTKPQGHEGNHGQKPPKPADLSAITSDLLDTFEAVPDNEFVPVREAELVRSPEQEKVDRHVKSAHESWVIAGKPKSFNDAPRQRYKLRNQQEAELIVIMLRKAERFLNVRVRVAPFKKHTDGSVMVYWIATDKAVRKPNGQSGEQAKPEAAKEGATVSA